MPFDLRVDPRAGPSPAGPISIWRGSYASLPAAMLKPPTEGNRTIPVPISWTRDGQAPSYAVLFNARLQQVLNFTQICSLHVDNTRCSTNINIVFPDTGFQVQLHANSEGFYPVLTNGLEFVAFTELQPVAGDVTTIQVMNFLPPPIEFGGTSAGAGVGTVRQVDTVAPIQGGPITDTGSISLSVPLAINFGGTAGATRNVALDNLSNASGATAGGLTRSSGGIWSVTAAGTGTITEVNPGNGMTGGGTSGAVTVSLVAPVSIANGGTGAIDAPTARLNLGVAPLNSPAFTGTPSLVTNPPLSDNTQAIVTASWVKSQNFGTGNGTVTGVTAGSNLTGGGTSGVVGLALNPNLTGALTFSGPSTFGSNFVYTGPGISMSPVAPGDWAQILLQPPGTTTRSRIVHQRGATIHWELILGNGDAADNFGISRYNDAGTFVDAPIGIDRSNGVVSFASGFEVKPAGGFVSALPAPTKIAVPEFYYGTIYRTNAASSVMAAMSFNSYPDTQVGTIQCNSTGTAYGTTSDGRLKEDLQPFDAGPVLDAISVYDFAWKVNGERAYGIVAQEVEPVYPQAIVHDEIGDNWSADYSKFVPLLLQEIKSLRARVASLEGATP